MDGIERAAIAAEPDKTPTLHRGLRLAMFAPKRCDTNRVRAADAVEAIAVEVFRQCECGGQPLSMAVINRVLNPFSSHLVGVLVWA